MWFGIETLRKNTPTLSMCTVTMNVGTSYAMPAPCIIMYVGRNFNIERVSNIRLRRRFGED